MEVNPSHTVERIPKLKVPPLYRETALAREQIKYHTNLNGLIAHSPLSLEIWQKSPINEIIIGPKSSTKINTLEFFLKDHGFENIEIKRSDAPYR